MWAYGPTFNTPTDLDSPVTCSLICTRWLWKLYDNYHIITIQPSRSTRSSSLVTLLHPQARSSLKITNHFFRYAAPHLWNKRPPSLRVPCQSATSECSPPLPGSDSAPKSVVGVSHGVFHSRLKLTFSPDPFPRNLPLSLTDWFHGFHPARVRKSLALKTLVSVAD